ncbi:MAG: glycosyl transferase family protein [Parcubacteria group bacterium Licking1014_17]|nr:MAG: glycosyl transferase family protein [Parcubacteria group bacterium Licking1014_17]
MKFSIVIPFYNEEKNVLLVLNEFLKFVKNRNFELVCVNDGSKDQTGVCLKEAEASGRFPFMKAVSYDVNKGYGSAIMSGVSAAIGDVICWTHADLQTDPADVFRAYELYLQNIRDGKKCIIKGRRIERRFLESVLTGGMSTISSIVLGRIFREINAQPKLFGREFVAYLSKPPSDFSLDLYLLYIAKSKKYEIIDFLVEFGKRMHGTSKSAPSFRGRLKTIWRTIKYIFRLRKNLNV